jgi:hypothetical protein
MTDYLALLKTLIRKKPLPRQPSKPSKGASEGFGGAQGRHIFEKWDELDWKVAFEERAAILEYDEGLSRRDAERLARQQINEQRLQGQPSKPSKAKLSIFTDEAIRPRAVTVQCQANGGSEVNQHPMNIPRGEMK